MTTLQLLLLVAAFVCFIMAAMNTPARVHLGWLGMVFAAAAMLARLTLALLCVSLIGCSGSFESKDGAKYNLTVDGKATRDLLKR